MLPAVYLAPYLRGEPAIGMGLVCLVLFMGLVLLYGIHAAPTLMSNHRVASLFIVVFFVSYTLGSPNWQQAFDELFTKGTHVQRTVVKDLAARIPKDAVVIGERSNQLFLAYPIKTATTFPCNSDPIPIVKELRNITQRREEDSVESVLLEHICSTRTE